MDIPQNSPKISSAFDSKGQVGVRGTTNGYPFRSTALPMGDGTHYLVVGKGIRDHISVSQRDTAEVMLKLYTEERRLDVPERLTQALVSQPSTAGASEKMAYLHEKERIIWIMSVKKTVTR